MIKINGFGNATQSQKERLIRVLSLTNEANASDKFKSLVLGAKFTETNDSNETIYANTQKDVEIMVWFYTPTWWDRFKTFFTHQEIVAAESGSGSVTFNASVFDKNSDAQLGNTIRHEGMHCPAAGNYKHDYLPTAQRPSSVPYLCGTFIQQILEKSN